MCLGVPGKIVALDQEALPSGTVDFGGVRRKVCLAYVPEAQLGSYVLVHVGFAISTLDEAEAARTWALLEELALLEEGIGE